MTHRVAFASLAIPMFAWCCGAQGQSLPVETCPPFGLSDDEYEALQNQPQTTGPGCTCGTEPPLSQMEYGAPDVWYRPGTSNALRPFGMQDTSLWGAAIFTYGFARNASAPEQAQVDAPFVAVGIPAELGREYLRQALARWVRWGGMIVTEEQAGTVYPVDRNNPDGPGRVTGVADVAIGATNISGGIGASEYACCGGDVGITNATSQSVWGYHGTFRFLRNDLAHEFGHSLGGYHVGPQTAAHMLENAVPDQFEGLSEHEKRFLARSYGDWLSGSHQNDDPAGNYHWSKATNLGDLAGTSAILKDLSTNLVPDGTCSSDRAGILDASPPQNPGSCSISDPNPADDWFKFRLSAPRRVVFSVNPVGGEYWWAKTCFSCGPGATSDTIKLIKCHSVGNLIMYLYRGSPSSTTPIKRRIDVARGMTKTLDAEMLEANSTSDEADWYYLLVRQSDAVPGQYVSQLYDLTVRVERFHAPPRAVAGLVHKRVKKTSKPGSLVICSRIRTSPAPRSRSMNGTLKAPATL